MKREAGKIFLSWRKGPGTARILVGVIQQNASGVSFSYLKQGVEEAKKQGFTSYTEFPDLDRTYTKRVLEIFGARLSRPERTDIHIYYDFWEIDRNRTSDIFYMLAHTQGISPNDGFEFLADFYSIKGLSFISEISGLSHLKLSSGELQAGDVLRWKREPDNEYDKYAVRLYKGDKLVGYVKKAHSRLFYKDIPKGSDISVTVTSVNKNGHVNRAFIRLKID